MSSLWAIACFMHGGIAGCQQVPDTDAWSIKFDKEDREWRMTAVDPIPTPLFNYHRIEELIR